METTSSAPHPPSGLWLRWTLATSLCTLGALAFEIFLIAGTDNCVAAGWSVGLVLIVAPLLGIVGGIIQASVLRPYVRADRWIAASVLSGLATPFILGRSGALAFFESHAGGCGSPEYASPLASVLIAGCTLGVVFGVSQGLALRTRSYRWWVWIPVVMVGWSAGFAALEALESLGALAFLLFVVAPGAITGAMLVWILQRPRPEGSRSTPPVIALGASAAVLIILFIGLQQAVAWRGRALGKAEEARAPFREESWDGWKFHVPTGGLSMCGHDLGIDPAGQVWVTWHCAPWGARLYGRGRWQTVVAPLPEDTVVLAIDPRDGAWLAGRDSLTHFSSSSTSGGSLGVDVSPSAFDVDTREDVWIAGVAGDVNAVAHWRNGQGWTIYTPRESGLLRASSALIATQPTKVSPDVHIDGQGRIWVAIGGAGISMYDGQRWHSFSNEALALGSTTTIKSDSSGRVWFGTSRGLVSFDGKRWTPPIPAGAPVPVENFAIDDRGRAWVVSRGVIHIIDDARHSTFTPQNSGLRGAAKAVAVDRHGSVWVITDQAVNVISPSATTR